jgi:hypothetical protein
MSPSFLAKLNGLSARYNKVNQPFWSQLLVHITCSSFSSLNMQKVIRQTAYTFQKKYVNGTELIMIINWMRLRL